MARQPRAGKDRLHCGLFIKGISRKKSQTSEAVLIMTSQTHCGLNAAMFKTAELWGKIIMRTGPSCSKHR